MKSTSFLIIVLLLTGKLFSQNSGEITGKVIDDLTKTGIPFASLQLTSDDKIVMQSEADYNGTYVLKPLQAGIYNLEVFSVGYGRKIFNNISVDAGGLTFLECAVTAGAIMDTLVVYAPMIDKTRPEIITTFKDTEIKHMPVSSPLDVAKLAPTVQSNERSGGLYIGGSREDATLYVVDGVKVIGSLYVPMNAIKSISVITGGIPANYGDVTGGIVEITTKGYAGIF